jgi:glycerol-3-phosphate cytidylyltransferase
MSKKIIVGYTAGVYDLFHIGHLNILKNAKSLCDKLIVGVSTDELVKKYKKKTPIIPYEERVEIVRSIKHVDAVTPQETMNKYKVWEKLKFDLMIVGDDWFKTDKWKKFEKDFLKVGVKIIFFPHTKGTSSTLINQILIRERERLKNK